MTLRFIKKHNLIFSIYKKTNVMLIKIKRLENEI